MLNNTSDAPKVMHSILLIIHDGRDKYWQKKKEKKKRLTFPTNNILHYYK